MRMNYEKSWKFAGDRKKAIDIARNLFVGFGNEISENSDERVVFIGKGFGGLRGGQNPLSLISYFEADAGKAGELTIKAEFGGIKKLMIWLVCFIFFLAILFVIVFGVIFRNDQQSSKIVLLSVLPFLPWIFIIPLMGFFIRKKMVEAIETLGRNMVAGGGG
jgi:hypothetical protein